MALAYIEKYTVEDYQYWREDFELIYGDAYAMAPSPSYDHQSISLNISRKLADELDDCPHCSAVYECDVELNNDTVVRPDVMVICYVPEDKLTKAPEIIFEVISPSTARRDEVLKFELYAQEGVKFYIMAYPNLKKAKCYKLVEGRYVKVADFSDEKYLFELEKCSIEFDFGFIWKK